ncbi:iron-siderophore ABC transporter substrate-binding protein [Streptomyces lushanensis]|uniref:iron-siderophore ABC transporter substrate-binding protein n=1 Tax=Streptomyces lushanensis TaxID=1434255 RepID=UPI0008313D39|nr:iron-siderophore ABC transporter substrate-binding protein [Streptomyces lushanensis]
MARTPRADRLAAASASVLLLFATVAACGGSDSDAGAKPGSARQGDGTAAAGSYPVTIAHKFGSTTVDSEPQRIVTVGLTDQDAVLALGKVPVGTTEWLGAYKGALGPWATAELDGGATPTLLKDTGTGPQTERIAALKPDLIIALYSGLTKEQYTTLSKFAPVLAQPKQYNDYGIPWELQTETIGRALGKEAEAKKLIDGVEAKFAQAREENPAFDGASGVMATPYEGMFVFGSQDPRSRLLTSYGFALPTGLDKAIGDKFGANISKERTDLLNQKVAVWFVEDVTKNAEKLHKDPTYGDLDVVKQGREVFVDETSDFGNALSMGTVLSLPYAMDRLAPMLAAAVDGDPATKVEQPAS